MTNLTRVIAKYMFLSGCVCFIAMTVLTVLDVVMRRFGSPLDFPFEIVCALAGIVISLSFPTTWGTGIHVRVEYIDTKLNSRFLKIIRIFNRVLICLFLLGISLNAGMMGNRLHLAGQHSPVIEIPEFPMAYILGIGCFVSCLVVLADISRTWKENVQ